MYTAEEAEQQEKVRHIIPAMKLSGLSTDMANLIFLLRHRRWIVTDVAEIIYVSIDMTELPHPRVNIAPWMWTLRYGTHASPLSGVSDEKIRITHWSSYISSRECLVGFIMRGKCNGVREQRLSAFWTESYHVNEKTMNRKEETLRRWAANKK